MPDAGENEADDGKRFPSDLSKSTAIKKTADGFTYLDPAQFHEYFAADLSADQAASCGGLQPSELFSPTFPLPDASRSGLNDQALIPQGILGPPRAMWLYKNTLSSHNMRTCCVIV
jgi:hypothetical protein